MKRYYFLILIFTLFSNYYAQNANTQNGLNFLVISDMGGNASLDQKTVAAAMATEAEKIKAKFVLTIGDNYHDDGIPSENDTRWKTEFEDVYYQPSLQIPWYPSIGNHDYRGSVDGEIKYSELSSRWKLPSRYYSHKERISETDSLLIIHLDTSPFVQEYYDTTSVYFKHIIGQNTHLQLRWLDSTLTANNCTWTLVLGHHPIYSAAPKHGDTDGLIQSVLPILRNHDVKIYMSGHDHILQHLQKDGMNFFICGGGAKFREVAEREDVKFGIGSLGFASISITKMELTLNFINSESKTIYTYSIKK